MKTCLLRLAFFGYLTLLFVGCKQVVLPNTQRGVTVSPTGTQQDSAPPEGDIIQMTPTLPTPAAPSVQNLIQKAKEDLAQRLSIPVSQISLVEATEVVWPNASLGCPQSGMAYAEVLTPGFLIILNASNQDYEYHASKGTELIYCENPTPPVPGAPEDI